MEWLVYYVEKYFLRGVKRIDDEIIDILLKC